MDRETIMLIKKGDREAFASLYNEYAGYALRTAIAITKDSMSAGDAVQETFIRVFNNIEGFDISKPFEPWFYKILINECNRLLKRNVNTVLIDDFTQNNLESSVRDEHRFEEYEVLYKAIEELGEENRIPIILKYLKGFKEGEIAQILELNINTVKSRLFKGRQKLKSFIEIFEGGSEKYGL